MLLRASDEGQVEIVCLLLEAGANKDVADNSGRTALTRAATEGRAQIVRVLLEVGANKDLADYHRRTSLMRACGQGHVEVVCFAPGSRCQQGSGRQQRLHSFDKGILRWICPDRPLAAGGGCQPRSGMRCSKNPVRV